MVDSISEYDLPLGVEMRHLAALSAIARTHSFSQAAAMLGYAQSAVSQQIATLERVIGHQLVERPGGPRPVSLTEAGTILLGHASHITARLGAAKADLDALAAGELGVLRVGTFQSASARLLPPTLVKYRGEWPNVSVELRNEFLTERLDDLVTSGQVDLAFSDVTDAREGFDTVELIVDPYVLIAAPDHPLAALDEVGFAALDGHRLTSAGHDDVCSTRVSRALERAGAASNYVFTSDDNLTLQRLVAAGLGVAVVPLLAVEMEVTDARVAVRRMTGGIERRIGITRRKDRRRSNAADAFTQLAVEAAEQVKLPVLPCETASA